MFLEICSLPMPFLVLLVENVNFEQTITPKLNMVREAQEGRRGWCRGLSSVAVYKGEGGMLP